MSKLKNRVIADKTYTVTYGVNQAKKVNHAMNEVDETPKTFIKKAALAHAKKVSHPLG